MLDERKTKGQLITELRELRQRLIIFEQEQKKLQLSITERKRAEEALRESQAQLQTIFDNLTEGVVVSTLDGAGARALAVAGVTYYVASGVYYRPV